MKTDEQFASSVFFPKKNTSGISKNANPMWQRFNPQACKPYEDFPVIFAQSSSRQERLHMIPLAELMMNLYLLERHENRIIGMGLCFFVPTGSIRWKPSNMPASNKYGELINPQMFSWNQPHFLKAFAFLLALSEGNSLLKHRTANDYVKEKFFRII